MSIASDNGYVNSKTENGICTIEFFHPQSNSLPAKILSQLTDAIKDADADVNAKVIILRSSGEKAFCAGASFNELMQIKTEEEGLKFFSGFANVINAMRKCSKFIAGRIQGKCVGGGVGLAAACDYAFAVEKADIKLSELALGIGPFVVGPAVEKKIGNAAFAQLAIQPEKWQTAKWANEKGLFAEVFSEISLMDEALAKFVAMLAGYNAEAMKELKKINWQGTSYWDELLYERAAVSGRLVLSDFTKNFIKQFQEKQTAKAK